MNPLTVKDVSEASANFTVEGWMWAALVGFVCFLIAADLFIHRKGHVLSTRRVVIESVVWVTIGLLFSLVIAALGGGVAAGEYLSGYVIEKSLSIDNVFVWSIIFASFGIASKYQRRVLFWGIFGALVLRAIFIFAGVALIERFAFMLTVFGVILIISGIKVLRHRADEGHAGHDRAVKLLGRFMPVSKNFNGQHFTILENGKRFATPLLAALVVVEFTDVIFAVDSVPAVLAVSREPFIVFAANAFAILGLRSLYFLLAGAKDRFHYLSHGLGAILIFVGLKMTISEWYHVPTLLSLGVISALVTGAIVISQIKVQRELSKQL